MNESLRLRLNQRFDRITDQQFLAGQGIGNEIAVYVFGYPPQDELTVRAFIQQLTSVLLGMKLQVASINLFEFLIDFIKEKGFLVSAFHLQKRGFYQDHLKYYRKRPVYWLFSSGPRRAFSV